MPGGTGLLEFKKRFPDRLFDVGIAEEHAVSMAGGLAKQGMIPVVAIYSTFLQRSYDMILQDVALLKLPVIFAVDRAGLVGEDGETHHGVFDVGFLRHVPGMRILCPASTAELREMLTWAVQNGGGPIAIRYPRGGNKGYQLSAWDGTGTPVLHKTGDRVALLAYGTMIDMGAILGGRATVGNNCHVGAGAVLAGVIEPASATPVIVEDNVLIGANAVVIEGCRIGHDAVVAAGAVVVSDVAPNTVVAGCPARVIKVKDEKTASKTALVDALREL
jgi:deoxyxylulose-5-phosphate synthase